jgi:hypothetical protein
MGCGPSSTIKVDEHKAALASAEFSGPLSWSGLASIGAVAPQMDIQVPVGAMAGSQLQVAHPQTGQLLMVQVPPNVPAGGTFRVSLVPPAGTLSAVKTGRETSVVRDAAGAVLLKVDTSGENFRIVITDPATGTIVLLIANTTNSQGPWNVYSASAVSSGQQPEATPTGAMMYKLGYFVIGSEMFTKEPMTYFDTNDQVVLSAKGMAGGWAGDSSILLNGPDRTTAAAVVEGMPAFGSFIGTCTFAKGVDPIIAIAMSATWMSTLG